MSNTVIAKHYARLISLWPKDLLRPNQPFTEVIEHRAARFAPASRAPSAVQDNASGSSVKAAAPADGAPTAPLSASSIPDPKVELRNINALYTLLENRYSKQYPVSQGVLHPTSNPEHYDNLVAEIERAPNKSWLQAKLDEWKMKIRWQ